MGEDLLAQSRLQTKSEYERERNSLLENERPESLTADVGTVFHHLELNFILAARCAFTLLFQGHHATRLLLCPEDKTSIHPRLMYGYCQEIATSVKEPDKRSGNQSQRLQKEHRTVFSWDRGGGGMLTLRGACT